MGRKSRLKRMRQFETGASQQPAVGGARFPASETSLGRVAIAVISIATFLIGAAVRLSVSDVVRRSPDEQVYVRYATAVAGEGFDAFARLAREYNQDRIARWYPTPVRVGYIWPLAWVMRVSGVDGTTVGVWVSRVGSVLALLLLAVIGWRVLPPFAWCSALILMAVSPTELAMARRVWQDGPITWLGAMLAWTSIEIARRPHRVVWYVVWAIVGAWLCATKESGVVVCGIWGIWLLWVLWVQRRDMQRGLWVLGSGAVAVIAAVVVMAQAAGGIGLLVDVVRHNYIGVSSNDYATQYQAGPLYTLLRGYWLCSPVATACCLIGVLWIIAKSVWGTGADVPGEWCWLAWRGCSFFLVTFLVIASVPPYYKNLRYISAAAVSYYALCGIGCWRVAEWLARGMRGTVWTAWAVILLMLTAVAVGDYKNFHELYVRLERNDLVLPYLASDSIYRGVDWFR